MPKSRSHRKRRSEAEWTGIFREFESSGLGSREFCRRRGLALSSFQRWRGRLVGVGAADFVELVPTSTISASPASWSLEVALPNGVSLRFRG